MAFHVIFTSRFAFTLRRTDLQVLVHQILMALVIVQMNLTRISPIHHMVTGRLNDLLSMGKLSCTESYIQGEDLF
jgi:hypothetical protein